MTTCYKRRKRVLSILFITYGLFELILFLLTIIFRERFHYVEFPLICVGFIVLGRKISKKDSVHEVKYIWPICLLYVGNILGIVFMKFFIDLKLLSIVSNDDMIKFSLPYIILELNIAIIIIFWIFILRNLIKIYKFKTNTFLKYILSLVFIILFSGFMFYMNIDYINYDYSNSIMNLKKIINKNGSVRKIEYKNIKETGSDFIFKITVYKEKTKNDYELWVKHGGNEFDIVTKDEN